MTETVTAADSGLAAVLDETGPRFIYRPAVEAEPLTVSFERVWPMLWDLLRADALQLENVVSFAEADPEILEALRAAAVDAIMSAVYESPARGRRVLSNAARFLPLRNFQICDMVDESADILLLRSLNLWVASRDVLDLVFLVGALLGEPADTLAIVSREA